MHRRHFLAQVSAALAAGALMPSLARAAVPGVPAAFGIQLYTLRDVLPHDMVGVLETLARDGYAEVEFAGYHERSPAEIRSVLAAVGLAAPSAHVSLEVLRLDPGGALEAAREAGHAFVVVPWLGEADRPTRDVYLRVADEMNALGERTQAAGMRLAYHNHDYEFETYDSDVPAYDSFVERLDPTLVSLELDLYWMTKAGYDPADYIARYPGRFPLWHVKDGRGPDLAMTDVGDGEIDFARLFALSETAGLEHAFVERDDAPPNGLATARRSLAALEALRRR